MQRIKKIQNHEHYFGLLVTMCRQVICWRNSWKHIQNPILLHLINGLTVQGIQACLKNLQKHVMTPKKAYVEDIMDEEDAHYNHAKQHGTADLLEEHFFFLDGDSDSDEGFDEEELAKLKTEDDHSLFQCHSWNFLQRHRQLQSKLQKRRLSQNLNRKGITQEIWHAVHYFYCLIVHFH